MNPKSESELLHTVWGGNLFRRFCNTFYESCTGRWAVLHLPCSPSKQEEISKNMLQNLRNKLPPQTVSKLIHFPLFDVTSVVFQVKIPLCQVDLAQTINEWKDVQSCKEDDEYLGDICFSLRSILIHKTSLSDKREIDPIDLCMCQILTPN